MTIPQGKPVKQPQYAQSRFSQSEYLVYDESQVLISYLSAVAMRFLTR